MRPSARAAFRVTAASRSCDPGIKYVEVMNCVAVPFGLKLPYVASISNHEASAAATPAANAQRRTVPDRPPGRLEVPAGSAWPLVLAASSPDGGVGIESCGSIGSAPTSPRDRAEVTRGDKHAEAP